LIKAIDITRNIDQWDSATTVLGLSSIVVLLLLKRSSLKRFADVLIIIIGTVVVLVLSLETVEIVGDFADIPRALPTPVLPDLSLFPVLAAGAVAAAVVGLAESSGVGSAYPNPTGRRSNMSRDFSGQGLGNLAGSFFQAMPAGGSLSRTGVNVSGGGTSRWAGVFAGLLMMIFVLLFGPLAELIPMAALAALLIVIGFEVMRKEWPGMIESWKISRLRSVAMIAVIVVGVADDLTVAIFVGVLLSLGIYVYEAATGARSYEIVPTEDGRLEEQPVREKLESNEVAIVQLRGSIYFASVYSFDEFLPDVSEARNSVVIMRERDRDKVSLTAVDWLVDHAKKYREQGNRLMFSGLDSETVRLYKELGVVEEVGEENLFIKKPQLGASTREAYEAAKEWIEENRSSD
jgi:SulP family sulfate permease